MKTGKALLGVLAGFAAGAVIGVLFAPEKGARTRRSIVRKGEDLVDSLNDTIETRFDELMDTVSDGFRKNKTGTEKVKVKSAELV